MTSDYGTYRLIYTPPAPDGNEDYPAITIEMSTGGDANVEQMLRFYEAFLAAAGYMLKGDLQVVERETNPWAMTARGSQGTDFIPFSSYVSNDNIIYGAQGSDTISFGAAQAVEYGAKTWDDVISFG